MKLEVSNAHFLHLMRFVLTLSHTGFKPQSPPACGFNNVQDTAMIDVNDLPFTMLEWHGGGTGKTSHDNAAALHRAFATKKEIRLGRGIYKCAPVDLTIDDRITGNDEIDDKKIKYLSMKGDGRHASIIAFPENKPGLTVYVHAGSVANFWGLPMGVSISDLGFRVNGPSSTALTLMHEEGTGNIRCERTIRNISIAGFHETSLIGKGIRIVNASYLNIDGLYIRGKSTLPDEIPTGIGISWEGSLDSLDNNLTKIYISHIGMAISVSAKIEGMRLTDGNIVHCNDGIKVEPFLARHPDPNKDENVQPWFEISSTHINTLKGTPIEIRDMSQCMISGNVLYMSSDIATAAISLKRSRSGSGAGQHTIIGNEIISMAASRQYTNGISLDADGNTTGHSHSIVSSNRVINCNRAISINNSTQHVYGSSNIAYQCNWGVHFHLTRNSPAIECHLYS